MDPPTGRFLSEGESSMVNTTDQLREATLVTSMVAPLPPTVPQIEPVPNKKMSRKRTKTGCLTCRKRRIKCGEERPICNNCIKSKRHCEGYNQRVIFKPLAVDWRSSQQGSSSTLPYHSGLMPSQSDYDVIRQASEGYSNMPLTPLRPRPSLDYAGLTESGMISGPASAGLERANVAVNDPYMPRGSVPTPSSHAPILPPHTTSSSLSALPSLPPIYYTRPIQASRPISSTANDQPIGFKIPTYGNEETAASLSPRSTALHSEEQHQTPPSSTSMSTFSPGLHSPFTSISQYTPYRPFASVDRRSPMEVSQKAQMNYHARHHSLQNFDFNTSPWPPNASDTSQFVSPTFPSMTDLPPPPPPPPQLPSYASANLDQKAVEYQIPSATVGHEREHVGNRSRKLYDVGNNDVSDFEQISPTQLLNKAAVEFEDDDYYDVDSTDDMDLDNMSSLAGDGRTGLGLVRSIHQATSAGANARRYDTFLFDGIMDHYRPEFVANPLKNPRTARVFAHFIHATGPSLSIFERNPQSTSAMLSGDPIPSSQQSLWTYTLPTLALRHQGLLHAMLALSSLHISKIKSASATPSFRHYAFALKRIHHCVGHQKKRLLIATIAATLLLGFYEILTADHTKWSSHLLGAKQLLTEVDFAGMAREYMRIKAEQAAVDAAALAKMPFAAKGVSDLKDGYMGPPKLAGRQAQSDSSVINEGIVGTIVGRQLSYTDFGRVLGDTERKDSHHPSSKPFEVSRFEVLQDLFWWYCKQDAYHSILSGDPLLLDYRRWSECPPRCALGKPDGVHGAHDHMMLLLGRIADFSSRDRKRKIKAMQMNGGVWKPQYPSAGSASTGDTQEPTTSRKDQGPTSAPNPAQAASAASKNSVPFYGMAPSGKSRMPSSYGVERHRSPSENLPDEFDLATVTESAVHEWQQIRQALDVFSSNLGSSYQPLSPEYHTPIETPFGEAIHYRRYDIAVLWAIFYMTKIILVRSHPSMPPAATMAAGVAAQQTAWIANTIGRIAAGIAPTSPDTPLSPSLGSALVDSAMPLFFAGVQYVDATQRAWLVKRVRDTEARTSWASIGVIASGCETAWVKAAEAGRGPPYERTRDFRNVDEYMGGEPDPITGSVRSSESADRRFVHVNPGLRVHFAMGIIGEQEDLAT